LTNSAASPVALTVQDIWCQDSGCRPIGNAGVPAYEAVKPGLVATAPSECVKTTSMMGLVDTNGGGTLLPVKVVATDVAVQVESRHEYSARESLDVKRNCVKISVTSWKPPPLPPGDRSHEHVMGPDLESIPGPSPNEPVLAVSNCGPAAHCRDGAAVQKKRRTKESDALEPRSARA